MHGIREINIWYFLLLSSLFYNVSNWTKSIRGIQKKFPHRLEFTNSYELRDIESLKNDYYQALLNWTLRLSTLSQAIPKM